MLVLVLVTVGVWWYIIGGFGAIGAIGAVGAIYATGGVRFFIALGALNG